jgi:hypothetical protein
MKPSIALSLFASTLVLGLAAPAAAKAPSAKEKPAAVKATKDKAHSAKGKTASKNTPKRKAPSLSGTIPQDAILPAVAPAALPAAVAKASSFWIAADPHVPLAKVDGKNIHSVGTRGKDCGAQNRWAKPKSRWKAVDAWGQLTGSFEIAGSELYDVTGCREVAFEARSSREKEGAGLFVSEDSTWRPSPSVAWKPSAPELKRFERFAAALEEVWVNEKPFGKAMPLAKRTMFFEFKPPRDPNLVEKVDGAGKAIARPMRWAVMGGPILVVAYLGEHGHWKVSEVRRPIGLTDSYRPVAVFDLNGDAIPEIVYSSNDGPSYADSVLSLDPSKMTWGDAAASPGGATL